MAATLQAVFFFFFFVVVVCGCGILVDAANAASSSPSPNKDKLRIYGVNWKHKPGYHYRPRKNWINDPNGPMYWNGYYHIFYQYSLNQTEWGNIVWAHSVSTDLVNWKHLDPAIFPSKPFDAQGCWSGSATILPGKGPVILYTGLDPDRNQVQNVAYPKDISDPYLREWTKPDFNPVIFPNGFLNATSFRDPTTAWQGQHDGIWRTVVGSRRNQLGFAVLYRSKDFRTWVRAKHTLHNVKDVGMWECPDFYPVDVHGGRQGMETSAFGDHVKHVFKVSLDKTRYEYYTLGRYDPHLDSYVPDGDSTDDHSGLRYDYGNFYASKSFYDANSKRRILWGWSNESDTKFEDAAKGWSGIQLIPRTVWLHQDGKQLMQWPVEELNRLRTSNYTSVDNVRLHIGSVHHVRGFHTSEADVEVTFRVEELNRAEIFDPVWNQTDPQLLCSEKGSQVEVDGVGPFGLLVLASADLREKTAVYFRVFRLNNSDKHKVLMCHDPTSSSFMGDVWKPTYGAFVDVDIAKDDNTISLRNLIDNSVVESFAAGGKTCMSSRVYPTTALGKQANLFAFNRGTANVEIINLKAWYMNRPQIN